MAGLSSLLLLNACQANGAADRARPDSVVESEARKTIEEALDRYTQSDIGWVDYYADEYTEILTDGRSVTEYGDSLRAQWEKMYDQYDVVFTEHDDPTIVASGDLALHYNTVSEFFVDKATGDTLRNGPDAGTWIALWKKQDDGSWKIVLETYK
jgi:ketosteroid isomerase-like protein